MNTRLYQISEREKWDEFVASAPTFGLLQSWKWGEFKRSLGWKVFRIALEEGNEIIGAAQLLIRSLPGKVASIAYVPRGPLMDWSDAKRSSFLLAELHRIASSERAVFLKIEPPLLDCDTNHVLVKGHSFSLSNEMNQPKNSLIIDLQPELDFILAQMRKKHRQYIRRTQTESLSVRMGTIKDLPVFIKLMQHTARREKFPARSEFYYEAEFKTLSSNDDYVLLLAEKDNRVMAVRTICASGVHAAEFHAGSIDNLEDTHPNYLLVWEGIKWAKARGCKTYDLWGIPNEISGDLAEDKTDYLKRNDGLWGVYRFKSGFTRNLVSYIGAYDYVYHPLLYKMLTLPFIGGNTSERVAGWLDGWNRT